MQSLQQMKDYLFGDPLQTGGDILMLLRDLFTRLPSRTESLLEQGAVKGLHFRIAKSLNLGICSWQFGLA